MGYPPVSLLLLTRDDFSSVSIPDRLPEVVRRCLKRLKVLYIVLPNVKLALTSVSTMLANRVISMVLQFVRGQYPIANLVSPHCDPHEYIAAFGLYLLKIHPEQFC